MEPLVGIQLRTCSSESNGKRLSFLALTFSAVVSSRSVALDALDAALLLLIFSLGALARWQGGLRVWECLGVPAPMISASSRASTGRWWVAVVMIAKRCCRRTTLRRQARQDVNPRVPRSCVRQAKKRPWCRKMRAEWRSPCWACLQEIACIWMESAMRTGGEFGWRDRQRFLKRTRCGKGSKGRGCAGAGLVSAGFGWNQATTKSGTPVTNQMREDPPPNLLTT